MDCTLSNIKLYVKPHALIMINYFFSNSFPQYDPNSKDIPYYYESDPEVGPGMKFSFKIKNVFMIFQNLPRMKTLAC